MARSESWALGSLLVLASACGGGTPAAETPTSAPSAEPAPVASASADAKPASGGSAAAPSGETGHDAAAGEAAPSHSLACADPQRSPCVLPVPTLKHLCSAVRPDLAIALFAKDTPWLRVYLTLRQAESFNGFGGPSSQQKIVFDEELLVLGERKPDLGGMSVSGAGATYDVLRWDGSCASIAAAEVTTKRPPRPKHADITFRLLSNEVQDALRKDDRVSTLWGDRRRHCKGATMGEVTRACEHADRALNDRVADAVRAGLAVPKPTL